MFVFQNFFLHVTSGHRRLDNYITSHIKWLSFSYLDVLYQFKCVRVNGHFIKRNFRVNYNDIVQISNASHILLTPMKNFYKFIYLIVFNIIFESNNFLILNKPNGFISQYNQRNTCNNVVHTLHLIYGSIINSVHRLDVYTTGCLVFSKNFQALVLLNNVFIFGKIVKIYYGLIRGVIYGSCIISLLFDEKISSSIVFFNKKFVSLIKIIVVQNFSKYTLLKIFLYTGKKHQIRLSLMFFGYVLVGDIMYGFSRNDCFGDIKKIFLHARFISFCFITETINVYASFDYFFCYVLFILN